LGILRSKAGVSRAARVAWWLLGYHGKQHRQAEMTRNGIFSSITMILILISHVGASDNTENDVDKTVEEITAQWPEANIETGSVAKTAGPLQNQTSWGCTPKEVTGGEPFVPVPPRMFLSSYTPPGMSLVPTGRFEMGGGNMFNCFTDAPVHRVELAAFYMDICEIPFGYWQEVRAWATNHGYYDLPEGQAGYPEDTSKNASNQPVVEVSWYDCVKWCNARSEKEHLTPAYYTDTAQTNVYRTGRDDLAAKVDWNANGYKLPTEAEWEKAARGGRENAGYPWGDTLDGTKANYYSSGDPFDEGTTPVIYYNGKQRIRDSNAIMENMANGYRLYDMAGNVYEWCWDWYGELATNDAANPVGPKQGTLRIFRGGCWKSRIEYFLLCGKRNGQPPDFRSNFVGFRCVRGL